MAGPLNPAEMAFYAGYSSRTVDDYRRMRDVYKGDQQEFSVWFFDDNSRLVGPNYNLRKPFMYPYLDCVQENPRVVDLWFLCRDVQKRIQALGIDLSDHSFESIRRPDIMRRLSECVQLRDSIVSTAENAHTHCCINIPEALSDWATKEIEWSRRRAEERLARSRDAAQQRAEEKRVAYHQMRDDKETRKRKRKAQAWEDQRDAHKHGIKYRRRRF